MSQETKKTTRKLIEDVETLVDDVGEVVRVAVVAGSGAAQSVGESLRDTIKRMRSARDNVVMVRVNKEILDKLDELVEAGLLKSRSEAAAFLIGEGVKTRQGLFDTIAAKIDQIRDAKGELRKLLEEEDQSPDQTEPLSTPATTDTIPHENSD